MKVTVKLFASFRVDRFKVKEYDLPAETTCGEVSASLKISDEELGIILVNGRHVQLSQTLKEGDMLSLFPLVGGG